jgi:hypothetical protein
MGNNITCTINCNYRIGTTLYTYLTNMASFMFIFVQTVEKGDIITIIIIIIGATGTISKSFIKYVSNIQGNHEVKELQKTAILGTAHILRKVLT